MSADHVYFVASAEEVDRLDRFRSPEGQLPGERVAVLPGVDPALLLPALVAVLASDRSPIRPVRRAGGGPLLTMAPSVVASVQGADGDPELEWEDVVARWAERIGDAAGAETLLWEAAVALRRLCGTVADGEALYCWSPEPEADFSGPADRLGAPKG